MGLLSWPYTSSFIIYICHLPLFFNKYFVSNYFLYLSQNSFSHNISEFNKRSLNPPNILKLDSVLLTFCFDYNLWFDVQEKMIIGFMKRVCVYI